MKLPGALVASLLLLLLLLLLLAQQSFAMPPHRVQLEYEVKYSGRLNAEATATAELVHDGKRYTLVEESRGKGIAAVLLPGVLRRSATGTIAADGLRPEEFHDRRGNRAEHIARFDWAKGVLVHATEGKSESQAMAERDALSDRLSFLWTFAFRPAADLKPGGEIRATLSDGRGLSNFRYRVAGPETLNTPAGALQAIKLVKLLEGGDDRSTEIWLASQRHYVPVRILVVEKDGTRVDTMLSRFGA
jgi:hypothetical protein